MKHQKRTRSHRSIYCVTRVSMPTPTEQVGCRTLHGVAWMLMVPASASALTKADSCGAWAPVEACQLKPYRCRVAPLVRHAKDVMIAVRHYGMNRRMR